MHVPIGAYRDWPRKARAQNKPKRGLGPGLGPLAMPRHSHFLTLCQEYPGGPKLLLSLFLKFATSQVAQNPQGHGAVGPPPTTQAQTVAIGAPKAHMGDIHCLASTFFNTGCHEYPSDGVVAGWPTQVGHWH